MFNVNVFSSAAVWLWILLTAVQVLKRAEVDHSVTLNYLKCCYDTYR